LIRIIHVSESFANFLLQRDSPHRRDYLLAVLSTAVARADHLVVTGDITNRSIDSSTSNRVTRSFGCRAAMQ